MALQKELRSLKFGLGWTKIVGMPLIKLNRINKGGEIIVGSEHIVYIEVESKATTIHMTDGLLFSVEERMDTILEKVSAIETGRATKTE
jgi:uncharacterized protein YlzI (FlbEa/FlbD family)